MTKSLLACYYINVNIKGGITVLKKIILILFSLFLSCCSFAGCDNSPQFAFDGTFERISAFENGYAVVWQDGGPLLIDTKGTTALSGDYDEIYGVSEGFALFERAGKYGFAALEEHHSIQAIYDSANGFSGGYARVMLRHGYGMQYNYVDTEGDLLLQYPQGSNTCTFETENGSLEVEISNTAPFSDGAAAVCNTTGNWALIDDHGTLLTDFIFQNFTQFSNGVAKCTSSNEAPLYIDTEGNELFVLDANESYTLTGGRIRFLRGTLYGYADEEGNIAIEPQYAQATDFDEETGRALAQGSDGTFYVIDKNGNATKISAEISSAESFSDGLAAVRLADGNFAYVNENGQVCSQRFDQTMTCSDGLCPVNSDGTLGYIDKNALTFA